MNVAVVICGLVRNQARLEEKLSQYTKWIQDGYLTEVIFSTWIGEVDRYAGLRDSLKLHGVKLIEIEEPRLILKGGHQLHQMLSLKYGLMAVESQDSWILRTRVDLADNHEAMIEIFRKGTSQTDDPLKVGIDNKILVEYAQMFYPFLAGDAQFFGSKSDIEKLVNLSTEMELVFNRLAVEQTFFFTPFRQLNLFADHFLWNLPHISEIAKARKEQLEYVLESQSLSQVMLAWWLILDKYFLVGWNDLPNTEESSRPATLLDFVLENSDRKQIGADGSDVITSSEFIHRLLTSFSDEEQQEALKSLRNSKGPWTALKVDPETFSTYEEFRLMFSDLPGPKAARSGSEVVSISGAAQHFFVKNTHDDAATRYHEQITNLRRENDLLRRQTGASLSSSGLHRVLMRRLSNDDIEKLRAKFPNLSRFYASRLMRRVRREK